VRAFITGGNGFVGRHLAAHLQASGDDVTIFDLPQDITDTDEVATAMASCRPDAIYHLAALSHVGTSWDDPTHVLRVNVLGTASVLAAARREAPDATFLFVSSAEVYGAVQPDELPLTEHSDVRPSSPYAASKAAAEDVVLQAARGFAQKTIVVRPFNHVGPGQAPTFFVPAMVTRLLEAHRDGRSEVPVGNLATRRDFTDVRDVVSAYRLLVERGTPGETYNLATGEDCTMQSIADALVQAIDPSISLRVDPTLVRPVDVPVLRGDASKLKAATGWSPLLVWSTTLADIIDERRDALGLRLD
jgi:GDP-4-dehydro-6-deoxy-D-mannose reductase